jgi:hypothetical protein
MVGGPPQIRSVFAVPFAHAKARDCKSLNADLERLFLSRESDEYRNPTPSHIAQAELFESRFNLFTWPDACVQTLRRFMLDAVIQTVLDTTDMRAADLQQWRFRNHTWFHITRYAGSFVAHNHPLASWSAVYCVRAGEPVASGDSGTLRFFDPRSGAGAYADPSVGRLRTPFALKPLEMQLAAGELVIFPSYVFHEVSCFFSRDLRITVACNCWFE